MMFAPRNEGYAQVPYDKSAKQGGKGSPSVIQPDDEEYSCLASSSGAKWAGGQDRHRHRHRERERDRE